MLWMSLEFSEQIAKLDPSTGKLALFKVPTPHPDLWHIKGDGNGNIWFTEQQPGKLMKVDTRTAKMTEYAPPTERSGIDSVDVDRTRNLIWVAEGEADKMARFDPQTGTFTEFPLPSLGTGLKRIALDPTNPNRIWWCAFGSDRMGYVEVTE
jgi:streptogramin lyase